MAWVRYESEFTSHPKVQAIPREHRAAAIAIHHAAVEYCAETLTDGFVPQELIALISAKVGVLRPKKPVESLQLNRLFVQGTPQEIGRYNERFSVSIPLTATGFLVNDYLEYNPSAEQVKADRSRAADRKRQERERKRQGQLPMNVTPPVTPAVTQGQSQRDRGRDASRAPARARTRAHVPPHPLKGGVGTNGTPGATAAGNADLRGHNATPARTQPAQGVAPPTAESHHTRTALDVALDRVRNIGREIPAGHLTADITDALGPRADELDDDAWIRIRDLHADLVVSDP